VKIATTKEKAIFSDRLTNNNPRKLPLLASAQSRHR
jgi:hypothetical protein